MRHVGLLLVLFILAATFATPSNVVAQPSELMEPVSQEPVYLWYIYNIGLVGILLIFVGGLLFIGACRVVFRSSRLTSIASFYRWLLLPLAIGALASVAKGISQYSGDLKYNIPPTRLQFFMSEVQSAATPLVDAIVCTLPSILVLLIGQAVHTRLLRRRDSTSE
jgi:hypothetical protein